MLRDIDLARLNSLTKYPSIETYHTLGEKGVLTEKLNFEFTGDVVLTEKIDGTNGRIVVLPTGEWLIGSREEFFTSEGDLVYNTGLGIVDALRPVAQRLKRLINVDSDVAITFYCEVFGAGIGQHAKNYTTSKTKSDVRLFDVAETHDLGDKLTWEREAIASWREHGGQYFVPDTTLSAIAHVFGIPRAPVLSMIEAEKLPVTTEGMHGFLGYTLPATLVALDETARHMPEGIVLRTTDRSKIAKARYQDYERTKKVREIRAQLDAQLGR